MPLPPALPAPEQPSPRAELEEAGHADDAFGDENSLSVLSPASSPRARTPSSSPSKHYHQVQGDADILGCIRLLSAKGFPNLASPLPRMQEVPEDAYGVPAGGDVVVAVSHAWRNQAHPDPCGSKRAVLRQCLGEIEAAEPDRPTFIFFDFLSISQRPFRSEQKPRTREESASFRAALDCMHRMYFLSDYIIHLPWEAHSARLDAEGTEHVVSADSLASASFMQTRDVVQVQEPPTPPDDRAIFLFDQVVSVDGQLISSVDQLESVIAGARSATLRRYPYGLVNAIPADDRGWVFLERFITMVKCAMMDEASARAVVITPSPAILEQILEGASRLRQAALAKQYDPQALKQELNHFREELGTKKFSPASLDSREMEIMGRTASQIKETQERDVVCGIMREFVGHLEQHWDQEAARQRGLSRRLAAMVAATEAFFGDWDSFSPTYAAKMLRLSHRRAWPLLLLMVSPIYLLLPFLIHMSDVDASWKSQSLWWCLLFPFFVFNLMMGFSSMVLELSRARITSGVCLRLSGWAASIVVLCIGFQLAVAAVLDSFPVPLVCPALAGAGLHAAPLLYYCVDGHQRATPGFKRRLVLSIMAAMALVSFVGMPGLVLLTALEHVDLGGQVVLVAGFFLIKIAFEFLGSKFAKQLGGDAMPIFLITSIGFYQSGLCFAFTRVSHWLIALEQVSFDVMENLYYLWSLRRKAEKLTPQQMQYLLTSLALREFLELLYPLQFLVGYMSFYAVNRRSFHPHCGNGMRSTLFYLGVDVVAELLISCLTWHRLAKDGHAPIQCLKGLVFAEITFLHIAGASILAPVFGMHHPILGQDMNFEFLWLRDGYEWSCGLTWTAAA